jgi:DNA repair protein RecO (recombination protein O)
MSPTKTRSIVLQVLAYRESSYVLHLFTETNGLIHAIAKGIRRKGSSQQFLERGFLVEHLAYIRPHRDLHTLGNIQVQNFYPDTRTNIVKSGVRDIAFELLLAAITVADPHPEMFDFILLFLDGIENRPESTAYPWLLWRFYLRFSAMMGFGSEFNVCIACGRNPGNGRAYFNAGRGGVECGSCSKSSLESNEVAPVVREFLGGNGKIGQDVQRIGNAEKKRVTRLLDTFCRYHFDIRQESRALGFVEGLVNKMCVDAADGMPGD